MSEQADRESRKFGTDVPAEPTDEFVIHAFARGARDLWPDGRDPGWHATLTRWLAQRDRRVAAEAWDAAVRECHDLGWLHDFARSDALARNPYRAARQEQGRG